MRDKLLICFIIFFLGQVIPAQGNFVAQYRQYSLTATQAFQQKDYQVALKNYKKLLEMAPQNPSLNYYAALTYALLGKTKDAFIYLEKALILSHDVGGKLNEAFNQI